MKKYFVISILCIASVMGGCGGGGPQSGVPSVNQVPVTNSKLQLAVGTANIAFDGTVGLNVVATYRQPNGLSAVLADTPALTGPAGFVVPANATGAYGPGNVDAGTSHITGSPQVNLSATPVNSTFGTYTGVFSYGLGPFNSDQTGTAYYPGSPNTTPGNGFDSSVYSTNGVPPLQPQPYFSGNALVYVGGPPAYPFFNDGTFPPSFAGYSQGFTAFEVPPVTGQYSMSVTVSAVNAKSATASATATLTNTTPLPALATPTFTPDGLGGGSGSITVPADGRIIETLVYIADLTANLYYTVGPIKGTGTLPYTLPATLGPCSGSGCQNNTAKQTPSIASGDNYAVYAVSYDYPAFEASPPGNTQQTPTITGSNGQADVSMSPPFSGKY